MTTFKKRKFYLILITLVISFKSYSQNQPNQDIGVLERQLIITRGFSNRLAHELGNAKNPYKNSHYDYWIKVKKFSSLVEESLKQFELKLSSISSQLLPLVTRYNMIALSDEYSHEQRTRHLEGLLIQIKNTAEVMSGEYSDALRVVHQAATGIRTSNIIFDNSEYFNNMNCNKSSLPPLIKKLATDSIIFQYEAGAYPDYQFCLNGEPILRGSFYKNDYHYIFERYINTWFNPRLPDSFRLPIHRAIEKDCKSRSCLSFYATDLRKWTQDFYDELHKEMEIKLVDGKSFKLSIPQNSYSAFIYAIDNLMVERDYSHLPVDYTLEDYERERETEREEEERRRLEQERIEREIQVYQSLRPSRFSKILQLVDETKASGHGEAYMKEQTVRAGLWYQELCHAKETKENCTKGLKERLIAEGKFKSKKRKEAFTPIISYFFY